MRIKNSNKFLYLTILALLVGLVLAACTQGTDGLESGSTPTVISLNEPTSEPTAEPDITAEPKPLGPIRFVFMRDNGIYLYEDGAETLVVGSDEQTTPEACFSLLFPALSPDGKYLAYLEQIGEPPADFWDCSEGYLNVIEISPGVHQATDYKIRHFNWTSGNLINFYYGGDSDEAAQTITYKNVYYDPASRSDMVYETVFHQDPSTEEATKISAEYPNESLEKVIRFEDDSYYLVDTVSGEETLLFDSSEVMGVVGWSPSSRYVIFDSVKASPANFEFYELVVDTQNLDSVTEIVVGTGGAGGEISTGRKWYFEEGFATYCREELYYIDGRPPLPLTTDGGGGCNNEEGFVATSPGGDYAFLKFQDRFELHDQNGDVTVIEEAEPIVKARWTPKNFIWVNDDYMIIFESVYGGINSGTENPTIYLFDRQANIVRPFLENAYLVEFGGI
jgi:hypothetical protein